MASTTTKTPQLRVLFFDVFGTCVSQRTPIADELHNATKEALKSKTIDSEVRAKAEKITFDDWFELGGEWNKNERKYVKEQKDKFDTVDWVEVDKHRREFLLKALADRGLVLLSNDGNVQEGSLWDKSQLEYLGNVWHRLPPWTDTCRGLELLNTKSSTVALSNTYNELLRKLVAHSSIPFTHTYSSDMFHSYKPNPKVYLGAAEKLGVQPEECALVAAHLSDLKGAKGCGFYTIYVERPLEEKEPELWKGNIPDIVIKDDEDGLITVAKRLGIQVD